MHQDHQDTDRLPDYYIRYLYEPNSHQDRFNKNLGNKIYAICMRQTATKTVSTTTWVIKHSRHFMTCLVKLGKQRKKGSIIAVTKISPFLSFRSTYVILIRATLYPLILPFTEI